MKKFFVIFLIFSGLTYAWTEEIDFSKKMALAKNERDFYIVLEEFKDKYFKENRYEDFIKQINKFSKRIPSKISSYYLGISRYQQLKFFEEKQDWDNYFKNLNEFRQEIEDRLKEAINLYSNSVEKISLLSRLYLFKFYVEQNSPQASLVSEELVKLISSKKEEITDSSLLKIIAEELENYQEKNKAKKIYNIYIEKLIQIQPDLEKLRTEAFNFYKIKNLELSKEIFKVYMDRFLSSEKDVNKIKENLFSIANLFVYRQEELYDTDFAEEIFKKIEEFCGQNVFDEEKLYTRGFNLEKQKNFLSAMDIYLKLIGLYPNTKYFDELNYKIGIITAYILRDRDKAKQYFKKLAEREKITPHVITSIYQLGLLSQWEEKIEEARNYYEQVIEKSQGKFLDTVELAKQRLKEIKENKPIEYNLKYFLDVVFKPEYQYFERSKLELNSRPYITNLEKPVTIQSNLYGSSAGCFPVDYQYLWSGHLGNTKPSLDDFSFETSYTYSGTKEINLVVVLPSGVIDYNLDILDVKE